RPLCLAAVVLLASCVPNAGPAPDFADDESTGWPAYRGNPGSSAYSQLDQVDRETVERLSVAWTFRAGEASEDNRTSMPTNPILVNGHLYVVSPRSKVVALHPATGSPIWTFDPGHTGLVRGLSYWEDGDDRRILVPIQRYLYALNAD